MYYNLGIDIKNGTGSQSKTASLKDKSYGDLKKFKDELKAAGLSIEEEKNIEKEEMRKRYGDIG